MKSTSVQEELSKLQIDIDVILLQLRYKLDDIAMRAKYKLKALDK